MRRKLAAGNWKMNGTQAALDELRAMVRAHDASPAELMVCPPATLLVPAAGIVQGTSVMLGGQDCHAQASGAHTGDISAAMLADAGPRAVILGHSERRADHGETSALVRAKARAAHAAGLVAVICLGETLEDREAANTLDIIGGQLSASVPDDTTGLDTVIAYEPVWAIGTGRIPSPDQIA